MIYNIICGDKLFYAYGNEIMYSSARYYQEISLEKYGGRKYMEANTSFETLQFNEMFNQSMINWVEQIIIVTIIICIVIKIFLPDYISVLKMVKLYMQLILAVIFDVLPISFILFFDYDKKEFTFNIQNNMPFSVLLVAILAMNDLISKGIGFCDEFKEIQENKNIESEINMLKMEINSLNQRLDNTTRLLDLEKKKKYLDKSREDRKNGDKKVNMKTTLLIMATGIGSWFGGGIKQLEPVDENGHIIMDYSIHDAIEAGFNKVVFIIRKDIEEEFKEVIGDRIESICSKHQVTVDYAFQDINEIPGELPEGRTKPWGTGQAVLAAKDMLTTPFIVINADDYYGKEGFRAVHEYLVRGGEFCMAGFVLKNTLSDNGGVTRGICKMDDQNNLTEVVETKNIVKTTDGAEADGKIIDTESLVSMNMWGLTPEFLPVLEHGFEEFFEKEVPVAPMKAEYLIPTFIGELLEQGKTSVKVLQSNDTWYGMTYKEDVAGVKESFEKMLEQGIYRRDLFADL